MSSGKEPPTQGQMASDQQIPNPFGNIQPPRYLSLVSKPGRGRALTTTVELKPGQAVMAEPPFLIYPSSLDNLPLFCSRCFQGLPLEPLPCSKCHVAFFCSQQCLSLSHPTLLCRSLPRLATVKRNRVDLIFLLSAYSLRTADICLLLDSLHSSSRLPDRSAQNLHNLLRSLIPDDLVPLFFSPEITSSLLSKEKNNSFSLQSAIDVRPRAYGLYLWPSMVNHDCMPNVCQFDRVNDPEIQNNTYFTLRAMHTIPKGSEICINYVDLNMEYTKRKNKLLRAYQFKCKCSRCIFESQKKEGEESDMLDGSDDHLQIVEYDETYICYCGGLFTPLPPSRDGVVSELRECSCCGWANSGDGRTARNS